jgi:undecaprenyl-diphosphatase
VVSTLGSGAVRVALVALIVLALAMTRYWWSAGLTVAATGGAALLETLIKLVVSRPRPHLFPHAVPADGSSFPSSHAGNACAFALVTVYLLWHVSGQRGLTMLSATILVAFILLVGLSRVVLGVHYPTDVVGGYALAGAWVTLLLTLIAPALREEAMHASLRRHGPVDS